MQQTTKSDEASLQLAKGSSTLLRGLLLLERVARADTEGIGVTELSESLELDKSTVSRALATLRDAGYVRQGTGRRYHLTAKLARIAAAHPDLLDVKTASAHAITMLQSHFDEEVHVAVPNGGEMTFVNYSPSSQVIRSVLPTSPLPADKSAVGLAVLAALDHEQRIDMLNDLGRTFNEPRSREEWAAVGEQIAIAKERGWASYDAHDGIMRIAAAFTDSSGYPLGAISLSGPAYRMNDILDEGVAAVKQAAADIQQRLTVE